MIKTLLILGAGASKDIHNTFPTGIELINEIDSMIFLDRYNNPKDGPYISDLMNQLFKVFPKEKENFVKEVQEYKRELHKEVRNYKDKLIRNEYIPSISIDQFCWKHRESGEYFNELSRFSIAYLLKGLEYGYYQSIVKTDIDNWVRVLADSNAYSSLNELMDNLYVISFNYERLFIYLFSKYLFLRFSHDSNLNLINQFELKNILYIYGNLGFLSDIPFPMPNNSQQYFSIWKSFNLIPLNRKKIDWNTNKIGDFEKLVFLGFSFEEKNMENLNVTAFANAEIHCALKDHGNDVKSKVSKHFTKFTIHDSCKCAIISAFNS